MTAKSRGGQGRGSRHSFAVDLAHDFGGAIIFSFPLLMTMEMRWLGFSMDRFRLALFLTLAFVTVLGLSYFEAARRLSRSSCWTRSSPAPPGTRSPP